MKEYSYGICPYKVKGDRVFVLLNKTGRVGDWNFFKGKIEPGETKEECAVREFDEEASIILSPQRFLAYFEQHSPRKDVGIFLIDWTKFDMQIYPDPEEIFSWSWVELKEDVKTSKNQQKIYDKIHNHLWQMMRQKQNTNKECIKYD